MKKTLLILSLIVSGLSLLNAQTINTVAGNTIFGYSGDGGPATAAELNLPEGVATDAAGNMYITDNGNNCIRKVNTNGIITTIAGNGTSGYSGDGGQATAAELNGPMSARLDAAGNIYIGDWFNRRIRKVNTLGIITTFAGNGISGYSGDGGQATDAELSSAYRTWIDGAGNVYIADHGNYDVRMVNTNGIISTIAGNGVFGYSGDGGPATAAEFYAPNDIIMDGSGNIYIADMYNSVVRKINTNGIISTVAGNGLQGFSGDGGPATAAKMNYVTGICLDGAGNLYITDSRNNMVRMVDGTGTITSIAGNQINGYSGDGGPATAAEIDYPYSVTAAGSLLYIADADNGVIRSVNNIPTGIGNASNISGAILYPNPNNGIFNLSIRNKQLGINNTVEIYNMLGEKIYSAPVNSQSTAVSLPNAVSGLYLYKVVDKSGNLINEGRFVVHK